MHENERPLAPPLARPLERPAWLTYAQAGERLGLSPEAVRHRARRSGWRTQPGNDGRTLVLVPDDIEPVRTPDRTPVRTADRTPVHPPVHTLDQVDTGARAHGRAEEVERAFETVLSAIEAAHVNEVAALRERADAVQALADQAMAQLADASARADAEITTLRDVVDGLRGTLARAETRAAHAEQRANEADARVEQAKALVASLEAAATAKDARVAEADAAEQRIAADQARAEVEEARQAATAFVANVEADGRTKDLQLAEAEQAARIALGTVETLRQAEEARKTRGLVARLRAAWRGE